MDQEVEEVSFLPGEAILNKKAVYEPTKGQRFRQVVCTRGWAVCILLVMGLVILSVAVIAAFARPQSVMSFSDCPSADTGDTSASHSDTDHQHTEPQTYIATNGEPFPWKDLRLPTHAVPQSYNIFLHPNLTLSFFVGKVQMVLKIVHDTDFVIFHSGNLNVSNVKVFEAKDSDGDGDFNDETVLGVVRELEYTRNEMYYVQVATLLRTGMTVQIHADFRGSLASLSKMNGFYKSSYTVNGETRYMASTQFQSIYARQAFPCLDEPAFKANFSMSIVRDQQHISLFNTPLARSSPYGNHLVLDTYEPTVKMSTYLVAYVICDFKNLTKVTKSGVQVRIFAPEDKIYMGQYALDAAVNILDYYNTFFGVHYPLPKQDLIAIPNFSAGAMENWGLITYRDTSVLYDPDVSTQNDKDWVATVVAHELAHQWFGNLVTLEWWNDLWLNEGFASFVENIGVDNLDKELHKMDEYLHSFFGAQHLDSLASSHPIEMPIKDPDEIDAVFDSISYDKGSALIRMLRSVLGDEHFKEGLKRYLIKHAYGNARTADLWESLQEMSTLPSDLTVADVMNTWTQQMGYPVVTVTRKDGKLLLTQERFLMFNQDNKGQPKEELYESPFGYRWNIPFTFITSADPAQSTLIWMKKGSSQAELSSGTPSWIKGNVGTVGFYRVNYDNDGWQAIIRQLSTDFKVFSVADRMGLLDDAFSLARAGLINYTIPLDMSRYLINESNYFVWQTALSHLSFITDRLYLVEEYDQLKAYTQTLAKGLIDAQDWEKKDKFLEANMQSLMIAQGYHLDYQPIVDKAISFFNQWKENPSVTLNNGLRHLIYSAGVRYGTKADWDLVFDRYTSSIIPTEKLTLLASLAAPRDARVLQILLQYSLDDTKVKSQNTGTVLSHVSSNANGQLLTWRFFRQNWDTFFQRYGQGAFIFANIVRHVTGGFNTQFDYDEIANFFHGKNMGSAKMALDQALEVVQSHIDWTNSNAATVKSWLKKSVK